MKYRKLLFSIIFIVVAATASIIVAAWRAPLIATLPAPVQSALEKGAAAGVQTLHEMFGAGIAENFGSGSSTEVVLDDGALGEPDATVTEPPAAKNPPTALEEVPDPESVASTSPLPVPVVLPIAVPTNSSSSCAFPSPSPASPSLSRRVILNEIAWMGSPSAANGEWLELKNISTDDIELSGWKIMNASGKLKIHFEAQDRIAHGGFFLLSRGSTAFPYAHVPERQYSGDLRNAGDDLSVLDPGCVASDFLGALANGWPAGNNTTKQTMERDADGAGWHGSISPGGTPGAENSVILPPPQYKVTVIFQGGAGAMITSDPVGMECTAVQCTGTFIEGTELAISEQPAAGAVFDGWSGACSGNGKCSFTVNGISLLTAAFHLPIAEAPDPVQPVATPTPTPDPVDSGSSGTGSAATGSRILIAAVQIAGASSTNDFVKLYNSSSATVDLGGWKLRKKSQTGADYSLREIPTNSAIAPGEYFTWANSAGGFSATIGAGVASTETLAADNSVALIDGEGNVVDALAWGTGTGQYGEGAPFLTNPKAGQVLTRKVAGGVMADTGNNGDDFILQ